MNIRPSLKLYLLVITILTGATTIAFMSVMSINYFIMGIDFSMVDAMRSQANHPQVSDGHPVKANDFIIASRWRDLPALIRENLHEHDLQEGELLKLIDGNPLFSSPKAGYFAIKVNHGNEVRFVSRMFPSELKQQNKFNKHPPPFFNYIIWIALLAIALFSLVPYFVLRNIATPVKKLILWTKQLNDKEQLSKPIPDFHYRELNSLASLVQNSLLSVQQSLIREQRFLGYASHELRTPIAVMRTNTELLRKMMTKNVSIKKRHQVVDRIERACLTMTDLTETLLWLNRQPDRTIPVKSLSIGILTEQLLADLTYLQAGKSIEINIVTDESYFMLPEALCRIIITNLLRNALQHTHQGVVNITQSKRKLIISNQNFNFNEDPLHYNDGLGFGLGLELTRRLVQHYGWLYKNIANDTGHYVEIDFSVSND